MKNQSFLFIALIFCVLSWFMLAYHFGDDSEHSRIKSIESGAGYGTGAVIIIIAVMMIENAKKEK